MTREDVIIRIKDVMCRTCENNDLLYHPHQHNDECAFFIQTSQGTVGALVSREPRIFIKSSLTISAAIGTKFVKVLLALCELRDEINNNFDSENKKLSG